MRRATSIQLDGSESNRRNPFQGGKNPKVIAAAGAKVSPRRKTIIPADERRNFIGGKKETSSAYIIQRKGRLDSRKDRGVRSTQEGETTDGEKGVKPPFPHESS